MTNRGASSSRKATKENAIMTTETAPVTQLTENDISVSLNSKVQFTVSIPAGMLIAMDKYARENDTDRIAFARKTLAEAVGYELPVTAKRSSKFASEDERKAAQAARNTARRSLLKNLLDQYMEDDDEESE